jgi:hypothetical protein
VEVVEVDAEADGGVTVWVVTSDRLAALCPGCGAAAGVKEQIAVAPADVDPGCGRARVVWVKRRRECRDPSCRVGTFTESLPQVPPRCRLTTRLREHAGRLVADEGLTVEQAARACGLSSPTVHGAFADQMDPLLEAPLGAVEWLGIDEHRRGRPRWSTDPATGEYVQLADRWHTMSSTPMRSSRLWPGIEAEIRCPLAMPSRWQT